MKNKASFLLVNSLIILLVTFSLSSCKKKDTEDEKKAPEQWEIIVYGIHDCIHCTDFEDELKQENIPFTFYDINDNNAKRTEMLDKLAAAGIPNSSIQWPVVDVITDHVSHMFIQPSVEDDIKPLIGL